MTKRLAMLAAVLALTMTAASTSDAQRLVTPLQTDLGGLKTFFNERAGSPRLVVIFSPT